MIFLPPGLVAGEGFFRQYLLEQIMQLEFNANKRDGQGTGASRRLRRTGRIPGILYGGPTAPQQIDIDHNELFQLLRKEAFYSSVLNLSLIHI